MEKSKKSKILFGMIIAFALVLISCISIITYAWFTDKKEYTGTLNFGEIKLSVKKTGETAELTEGKTLPFTIQRADGTAATKTMPGDTVNINLTVGLQANNEDAYYFVVITDTKNIFKKGAYFLDDSGNMCYYDATANKAYRQGTTTESTQLIGKITASAADALAIKAEIATSVTDQTIKTTDVTCKVVAIQQANLTTDAAAIAAIKSAYSDILA